MIENELAALQFFAKYDACSIEQIVKEALRCKLLQWYIKAINNDATDKDAIFKKWLDGQESGVEE